METNLNGGFPPFVLKRKELEKKDLLEKRGVEQKVNISIEDLIKARKSRGNFIDIEPVLTESEPFNFERIDFIEKL